MKRVALLGALLVALLVGGAQAAGELTLTVVSQTNSTITLGWTPQPGYGYLFSVNGNVVSRTNDPSRSSVKFSKVTNATYEVAVLVKGQTGIYPAVQPPPPPPPTGSLTQTIVQGSTLSNIIGWRAVYDANGDGVEEDPGKMEFRIDGVLVLTESQAPFGDTFATGSPSATAGEHTFRVDALTDAGAQVASNTVTATVAAEPPPPPPPPPPSGGYPDATNTGYPANQSFTNVSGLTISTNGAVYDGYKVSGTVTVRATGVVIRNSWITGGGLYSIEVANGASVTVEDTTITCGGAGRKGVLLNYSAVQGTFRRVNISNCEDGIYVTNNLTLEDSFIHDLAGSSTAHNDGVQSDEGSNLRIVHNRIYAIDTSALNLNNDSSETNTPSNSLVQNNLLAGGAYSLYCPRVRTSNFQVLDNHFSTIFSPKVGWFGPATDCYDEIQSGNVIHETNEPITLG